MRPNFYTDKHFFQYEQVIIKCAIYIYMSIGQTFAYRYEILFISSLFIHTFCESK